MLFERLERKIKNSVGAESLISERALACLLFFIWRRLNSWRCSLREVYLELRRSYVCQCNTDLAQYVRIVGDSSQFPL